MSQTLLQQDVEFGTVLVDGSPQQIRLAARRFDAMREACVESVAPASNRFIADDNPALGQQLLDVAKAQLKPEYQRTA